MEEAVMQRRAVELDLRQALNDNQFYLDYQPLVTGNGTVKGVEALIRWNHPKNGLISPSVFVPIAEETGLIVHIGEWVLRQAFADSHRWPGIDVSINISPIQFRHPYFLENIQTALKDTGTDATRIQLEITEGILIADVDWARRILLSLRAMGFHIALDDFGTGYSSLSYLREFPFDKLKIDRSFVSHVGKSIDAAEIVQAVVALSRALGMTVVAEGVETRDQVDFLRAAGCQEFQGYFFSKPISAERISERLLGAAEIIAA
jgi:diguanylate cyclase